MQRKIHTAKEPIHAKVTIPGSKNITHRALLLAALADGVSELSGIHISRNTIAFINALHQVGIVAQLDQKSRSCIIAGCNGKLPKKQATLWCENAKSVAYFLMAACAGSPGVYYFDGTERLRQLDLEKLLNVLYRQGAQLIPNDAKHLPLTLIGGDTLEGGEVIFDEPITSRLLSALLMIAPYARNSFDCNLHHLHTPEYIDMTCMMMAEFGVLVHRIHQGQLMVPVPQRYQARDYVIEPDYSIAAYFFAAAAITGGEITIPPNKRSLSKQIDIKFLSVLEKMGCRIFETHTGLTLRGPSEYQGIEISMLDFSDTFAALVALAPFAKSPTRISHVHHMTPKESNRMAALKSELIKMNIQVETGEDWIQIFPGRPQGGLVNTHNDYRIAMAFSVMGLKVPGIVLDNDKAVLKRCSDFFTLWDSLLKYEQVKVS